MQTVLACKHPIDLDEVLAKLRQANSAASSSKAPLGSTTIAHLVVFDRSTHPVGCVPIAKLITAFPQLPAAGVLLEPIACLPESTSLPEFWEKLQTLSPDETVHWGVTDTDENFLGLVDLEKILPALARGQTLSAKSVVAETHNPASAIATQRLILENRLKDKLLAEISHDLKNPLTAILGLFNILQQSKLEHITDRQQQYLKLIDEKTQQLMTVVQEIMLLSQLQNQQRTLQLEVVELSFLCEQVIASCTQSSRTSVVQLHIDQQIPPLIADLSCLQKILSSLIKQMLALSKKQITLQVEQWGGWIAFTASTQAPTAEPSAIKKRSAVPLDSENNRLDQYLAHQLARLHQGAISVFTNARGSRQVTLLIPPNLASLRAGNTQIAQLSQRLALVVAQDLEIIEALKAALQEQGYRVAIAQSGLAALNLPHQLQPAVVFLEQSFALPSGGDTLALIKDSAPVILLGKASAQHEAQAVLSQPITHQAVADCLDIVQKRVAPPSSPTKAVPNKQPEYDRNLRASTSQKRDKLTILQLETSSTRSPAITSSQHLNQQGCRVISIENLEEAALLLQIWNPQVILYTDTDPAQLQQLNQNSPLIQLPIVVTAPNVAAQARHIPYLDVYEYSASSVSQTSETGSKTLVQVLQTVAGIR
ncbi:Histidine protein kinase DivJ [Acaryochloris thomasi RCC1774]|uniref:histidine kinase n=1 Tax=Acaryochloris thomasi RCC1774 TaxID=1764569 RepID=A0A2W1JG35_9CYAN|nr:Histidine protein kinase DivJ [Acaryochloris thomasi RCC1774]